MVVASATHAHGNQTLLECTTLTNDTARNKRTIADQEVLASGMLPLAFLCSVYRDAKQAAAPPRRREA